jgi:acetyl-CoA carboxylase biotin carboxylase subunit
VHKILIANRGEIAVRVIRAAREAGIGAVAVYSDCDRRARHVRLADEAWPLGGNAPADSYLRIDRLIDIARQSGADAVHPGYGFLAENAEFAAACRDAGLMFIGPTAEAIDLMGSKTAAREAAARAGVASVPGTTRPLPADLPDADVLQIAGEIGYPLMLKAVAGGGGKGMRTVAAPADLPSALRAARSEAQSAFGDAAVYLERRLERPRHVEVQLLGDVHGRVVPFVERECSVQRRHQKVLEESPSPVLPEATRLALLEAARRVAASVGYTNAGTIEFLLDASGAFYFLEMNTRLQVEHPITEAVTGIDLVQWQFRLARGERLTIDDAAASTARGHAIECRVYAEDPDAGFMPSPGRLGGMRVPDGPWVRDDSGADPFGEVSIYYDSLISKLVVWGSDRSQAIVRLKRALREYRVLGIRTTVPFFSWIVDQEAFRSGSFHTGYLDEVLHQAQGQPFLTPEAVDEDVAAIAAALHMAAQAGPSTRSAGRFSRTTSLAAGQDGCPPRTADRGDAWKRRARLEGVRG